MARPLSRETRSKCHYLWISTLVLACLFHISSGIDQVFKAAKENVTLSCGYQISPDELSISRIYWQTNRQVVLSIVSGDRKVWPEYENRTNCEVANNLSLVIENLHLSDEGTYTCVVQKKIDQNYRVVKQHNVNLSLRVDFPTPNITAFGDSSSDIKRLTCSASGGFPKPRLSLLKNGEDIKALNTSISQDHETKMYNITSHLDFNITTDHSFVCSIHYGNFSVSQNFSWPATAKKEFPGKPSPWPEPSTMFWVSVTIVALLSLMIAAFLLYKRRTRARTSQIYTGPVEASG